MNLGADDYITKPFSMGELVARVNSHLKNYEKLKQKGNNEQKIIKYAFADCALMNRTAVFMSMKKK